MIRGVNFILICTRNIFVIIFMITLNIDNRKHERSKQHQSTLGINVIWIIIFPYELRCQLRPLGRDLGKMMEFLFGPTTLCGMLHRSWVEFVCLIFGSVWFCYFLSVAGLNLPCSFPQKLLPNTWRVWTLFIQTCVDLSSHITITKNICR